MPTVTVSAETTITPAAFTAALTNFGPGRGTVFTNSDESAVTVHARGDTWADVTEGSTAGVWERLRYDWSEPAVVRLTTIDSNAWANGSSWTYTLVPEGSAGMRVDLTAVRIPRSAKGRMIAMALSVVGRRYLGGGLRRTLRALESVGQ